jgi:hypothetical protein
MKLTTTNKEFVEEEPWGTYVFQCHDGEVLGDDEGRLLSVFGFKNDQTKIKALQDAAKHYGYGPDEGDVVYWPGRRPVSDEEYEEQETRQRMGLVPDPLDYGAIMDGLKAKKQHGR